MAFIDHRDVAEVIRRKYKPGDNVSKFAYKNPSQCVRFHMGVVEDNKDPDKKCRLKIRFPQWGETFISGWVPIIRPYGGKKTGMFFLPEIGEAVLCVFINDNPQHPVVVGSIRRKSEAPPVSDPKDNDIKKIVSRSGSTLLINDKKGEERIEFSTKDGNMRLIIDKEKGITILNKNGDINIKCRKLTIKSTEELQITNQGDLTIKSSNDEIKIDSSAKDIQFKSSSDAIVKGTKIKFSGMVAADNMCVAKKDDMVVGVDIHQVKVPAGNTTVDVPLPHPYIGEITKDVSNDVEIDDKGVATKDSGSKHKSPGHIAMPPGISWSGGAPSGEGKVSSGTKPTVKVNDKEIAVLGSMVKTCNFPSDNETCTIVAIGATVKLPIMLPGMDEEQFKMDGGAVVNAQNLIANPKNVKTEERSLSNARWSSGNAKVGEEVTLSVKLTNQYEQSNVFFKIFEDGADTEKDKPVAKLTGRCINGEADAKWRYIYIHNPDKPLTKKPKFFFEAWSFKCGKLKSGSLEVGAEVKAQVINTMGEPAVNAKYTFNHPDGTSTEGKVDSDGLINEKDLIPGIYKVIFKIEEE